LCAHTRQKLLHMKRLSKIIVSAGVHAGHLVAPTIPRGENDNWHLAIGAPPLLEDGNAVHLRQPEIEDHDVIGLGIAKKIPLLPVARAVYRVAGVG